MRGDSADETRKTEMHPSSVDTRAGQEHKRGRSERPLGRVVGGISKTRGNL